MAGEQIQRLEARFEAKTKEFEGALKKIDALLGDLVKRTSKSAQGMNEFGLAGKQSRREVSGLSAGVADLGKALSGLSGSLVAVAASLGAVAQAGGRVVTVTDAFERRVGGGAGAINSMRAATEGLIDDFTLMEQHNRALMLGAVTTTRQFNQMARAAIVLGRAVNEEAGFALQSLTLGIGRQSRLFLDNLGLIIKVEEAYRRYAVANNLVSKQLSEAQQKEAFRLEAFRLINEETRRLGGLVLNAGDAFNALTQSIENAFNEMRALLARSERLKGVFNALRISVTQFVSGVSDLGQAEVRRIGLLGLDDSKLAEDLREAEAIRDQIGEIISDPVLATAASVEPTPLEGWLASITRLLPEVGEFIGEFMALDQVSRELNQTMDPLIGMNRALQEALSNFGDVTLNSARAMRELGLSQADVLALNEVGITTLGELFDAQARVFEIAGKKNIPFKGLADLIAQYDAAATQVEIIQQRSEELGGGRELEPAVLSWGALLAAQERVSKELDRIQSSMALATTTQEEAELGAELENVVKQYRALNDEVMRRGPGASGVVSPFFRDVTGFPAVLDDLVGRTRSRYDDMILATTRLRRELEEQWGLIPQSLKDMLDRLEDDAGFTLFTENATDSMDALQRAMDDLGRRRAGPDAFRDMAKQAGALRLELQHALTQVDEQSVEWERLVALIERAKKIQHEANEESLTFWQRIGRFFEDFGRGTNVADILTDAFGGSITGIIDRAVSGIASAIRGLFERGPDQQTLFREQIAAIKENTEALRRSARGAPGARVSAAQDALNQLLKLQQAGSVSISQLDKALAVLNEALRAAGIDFEAHIFTTGEELEELGKTLNEAFADFVGAMDLARAKIDAFDVEDPAEQFAIIRDTLADSLGGALGDEVADLSIDEIDKFFQDIIQQIEDNTFDFSQLGDEISVDEFIRIVSELERLGDAAGDAADALGSTTRNVPEGFRVALARFEASAPEKIGMRDPGARPVAFGGAGAFQAGEVTQIGSQTFQIDSVTVVTDDPDTFWDEVQARARREARRGGTNNLQIATRPRVG